MKYDFTYRISVKNLKGQYSYADYVEMIDNCGEKCGRKYFNDSHIGMPHISSLYDMQLDILHANTVFFLTKKIFKKIYLLFY